MLQLTLLLLATKYLLLMINTVLSFRAVSFDSIECYPSTLLCTIAIPCNYIDLDTLTKMDWGTLTKMCRMQLFWISYIVLWWLTTQLEHSYFTENVT